MPTSGATPIASSTGDNLISPAWQAEPVEAATSGMTREDVRADAADKRHVERVGQAPLGMAIEDDAIAEGLAAGAPRTASRRRNVSVLPIVALRNLARLAKRRREQRALGAGAPAALMAGAVDERFDA